jgi:crossover junction endodeoxyribonuclease RuvC
MNIEQNLFLGADPGLSGGLALLDESGAIVDASKMPETEHDLAEYVREFAPRIRKAVIEGVHSMPQQGVSSAFKFGRQYGSLRMALIAHGIKLDTVTPQAWQRRMGLVIKGRSGLRIAKKLKGTSQTQKKNRNKARAQELFPKQRMTHAIADALLLAEFCRLSFARTVQPLLVESDSIERRTVVA